MCASTSSRWVVMQDVDADVESWSRRHVVQMAGLRELCYPSKWGRLAGWEAD